MSFAIWGIGTAVPEASIGQEDAAGVINRSSGYDPKQSRWVESVSRGSGVERRHLVMLEHLDEILESPRGMPRFTTGWRMGRYEEAIVPMAAEAAGRAPGVGRDGGRRGDAPGHGLLHRVRGPGVRPGPLRASGARADGPADACGVHGLPRGPERPPGGRGVRRVRPVGPGPGLRRGADQPALPPRGRPPAVDRQRPLRRRRGGRGGAGRRARSRRGAGLAAGGQRLGAGPGDGRRDDAGRWATRGSR